jgi:ubiquinone/menaquinone biosynthesis C-methylase UbiE
VSGTTKAPRTGFKQSRQSVEDYVAWRVERARPAVQRVQKHRTLSGREVLDVGCGYGALSTALTQAGAHVHAVEVDRHKLDTGAELAAGAGHDIDFRLVDSEQLPFDDASMDAVFLFDVIEHVGDPATSIAECRRVLRPGGILYVEFTPYYSLTGHHLYDFTKLPVHLMWQEDRIRDLVYSKNIDSFMTADDLWAQYESLNKLRVSGFRALVRDLACLDERYIIKYPDKFELNIPLLRRLGRLGESVTMSFEGIYRKERSAH